MAGHSKWNNIKHKKGAADAKRAKEFTYVARLIKSAVKEGGSEDPKFNPGLRTALDKARAVNMPKDNIQRAIERGKGKTAAGASIQEIVYEGFGPGGIGVLVVAQTDNPNRTGSEVRYVFSRAGGSLGGPGSASYLFQRQPSGEYICSMPLPLPEGDQLEALVALIDQFNELEDVEEVFVSTQLPEDIAE